MKAKRHILYLLIAIIVSCSASSLHAQQQLTRILFVFDASFSMSANWQSGVKMDIAKKLLNNFLDSLKNTNANLEIALRCYGHQFLLQPKRNCEDTKLEVPFGNVQSNVPKFKNVLKYIKPTGTTPIAHTLNNCASDFPDSPKARNIIILITDGIEECGGDPCAVSMQLQKKGIILKPFVIGIGLSAAFTDQMGCIGKFYDAASEENFKNILNVVISQALNNTTVQVNLLDKGLKPTETDVNMTFYDQFTGSIRYNYVHTLNHRGNPDTIVIDPIGTYHMVVHTLPPVEKKNITITPGKHNIISVDAPQGYLQLKVATNNYKVLPCIVRKKGEMNTLNVQYFNEREKYIVGEYDIEILTTPRIRLNNVNISQSSTTTIEIPEAGFAYVSKPSVGPGSIYQEENGKLIWVCNLEDALTQENFILQPGTYRIVYRQQNLKESLYTIEKTFKIEAGKTVQIKLY